jgi:hypothetical protein
MGLLILFCNLQYYYCMVVLFFPYYFSQYLRLTPYELMQTSDLKLRVHSLPAAGRHGQLMP